jgi:type III secretion system FlhB-like substrate exporter
MATRTDRVMAAAVKAAKHAKVWATAAAREADRLLHDAKKKAVTIERKRQLKKRLLQTARIMKAAGRAAVVAGLAAGIAAVQAERSKRALAKGRKKG